MSKYKALRTANGFPSKLEEAVWNYLRRREILGEISEIKRQATVILQDGAADVKISWRVDFSFMNRNGKLEYAEAKGIETGEYKLKLKLWRKNPPAALEIYKGSYQKIYLAERIEKWEDDPEKKHLEYYP